MRSKIWNLQLCQKKKSNNIPISVNLRLGKMRSQGDVEYKRKLSFIEGLIKFMDM